MGKECCRTYFVKLHAPWDVLTKVAEEILLRKPLKTCDTEKGTRMESLMGKRLVSCLRAANPLEWDHEDTPCITAHFKREKQEHFLGIENRESFFSTTDRVRVVEQIINQTPCSSDDKNDIGIAKLLHQGIDCKVFKEMVTQLLCIGVY